MDTTTAVPRPLRRDAELNRQRITAAAREVFAERGLDATLDDVARHAGLGVGTVYRRFPNKEALIDALFEETFARIVGMTERAAYNPDAWAGLVDLLIEMTEMQAADRGLRELMLSEAYGRDRVAQMRDLMKPLMERLVERAVAEGGVRDDLRAGDIPVLLTMITSTVVFTQPVRPQAWRRYVTILLDGLCRRRERPTQLTEAELSDDDLHTAMHHLPPDSCVFKPPRTGAARRPEAPAEA